MYDIILSESTLSEKTFKRSMSTALNSPCVTKNSVITGIRIFGSNGEIHSTFCSISSKEKLEKEIQSIIERKVLNHKI